jgi:hypothetical protein
LKFNAALFEITLGFFTFIKQQVHTSL